MCQALDVAARAVDRLAETGYAHPDGHEALRPEKVIYETAYLLLVASRVAHDGEILGRVRRLSQRLSGPARSARMLLGVCIQPTMALDYAGAHICLSRLGVPDEAFDAVLKRSLGSLGHRGRERPPHRMLEQAWLAGRRDSASARASAVGRPMDLLGCSREDVYGFTHSLMYLCDGERRQTLPRSAGELIQEAEALLAWSLDEEDYDLAGEILLAWPLLRKRWSPAATFGFHVLALVEDEAGFLPTPSTRPERAAELEGTHRAGYVLATAYHTVYVMGVLCATILASGFFPAQKIHGNDPKSRLVNELLTLPGEGSRPRHWRTVFERLSPQQRGSLQPFLLAVAIRRAASRREFERLRFILGIAAERGLTDSPIAAQAAELLERLSAAAPALGFGLT